MLMSGFCAISTYPLAGLAAHDCWIKSYTVELWHLVVPVGWLVGRLQAGKVASNILG